MDQSLAFLAQLTKWRQFEIEIKIGHKLCSIENISTIFKTYA